jgi:hypothetical protein
MLEALSVIVNVVFKDTEKGRDQLIERVPEQRVDVILFILETAEFCYHSTYL